MVNLTVRVHTVEGDVLEFIMDHQDSLDSLRSKIQEVTGKEASFMSFLHQRKGLLESDKTFEDYNIRPESVLDLILRFGGCTPLGGMPLPDPVPWYNDPIPELLLTRYKPNKDAIFEQMIAEMEAKERGEDPNAEKEEA
eukprot:gene9818-6894_t